MKKLRDDKDIGNHALIIKCTHAYAQSKKILKNSILKSNNKLQNSNESLSIDSSHPTYLNGTENIQIQLIKGSSLIETNKKDLIVK